MPPVLLSESRAGFIDLFSREMALALVAGLVLVALTTRRLGRPWPVAAVTFAAGALLLYPVAVTRYDAIVALALAVAGLGAALGGRYTALAYAALGFGTAAKLVPALAVPALAFARRWGAGGVGVFFVVLALFLAPALVFGGGAFLGSVAYHADRGLQVESVAASVLMALGRVEGVVFEFGAFEARGAGVALAAGLSPFVSAALLLATGLAVLRRYRARRPDPADFPRYAAALILAFMLGSKVLSPQYLIWLLPLVPLGAGGLPGAGLCLLFLAACLTTTLVFPLHYGDLLNLRSPGPQLLLLRNGLLAALWVALLPRRAKDAPA